MCGICGIVAPKLKKNSDSLNLMVEALGHRGPDGKRTHYFPNCGLGHSRLSIIDLEGGAQPMFSPNKKVALVFNGEIYGYEKIKNSLTSSYNFKTDSDSEVLLALYQKYGTKMLNYLPGMFSFAIWDVEKQQLFAARDRFGEKPFYYAFTQEGRLIFASEIKALTRSNLIRPKISRDQLSHYLQFLYVNPQKTIYENIYTLPPAHYLTFKINKIKLHKYWKIPEVNTSMSLDEATQEFTRLFYKAVANQLVADVPIGIFLSGGLDSSSIVAAAAQTNSNLKTFTLSFGDWNSELPQAQAVADLYQTDHKVLEVKSQDISQIMLEMAKVYDEPFADSSNIPTYLITKLAKQHVTVALGGDGGDELLAGYGWYKKLWWLKFYNNLPISKKLSYEGMRLAKILRIPIKGMNRDEIQGIFLRKHNYSIFDAHLFFSAYFNSKTISKLGLLPSNWNLTEDYFKKTNTLTDAFNSDISTYLPGDILTKTDRAAMANSLELRAPFLDKDLAEFLLTVPVEFKMDKDRDKILLHNSMSKAWPDEIKNRPKQGFGGPVHKWLKQNLVKDLKYEFLLNPQTKIYSILPYKEVQSLIKNDDYQTWILLTLSIWLEQHEI